MPFASTDAFLVIVTEHRRSSLLPIGLAVLYVKRPSLYVLLLASFSMPLLPCILYSSILGLPF